MTFTSDIVIGLEIHIELNTRTKLFCGCERGVRDAPNSRTCEVCLGMPGSKPVLNKSAIDEALKLALALRCDIAPELIFSRKSYFYPDLSKNYQISQYELPLARKGSITLPDGKTVRIHRIHIEEDPAALIHTDGGQILADYNRSGNPLVELVTEPDLTSPQEARDFMKQLLTILNYLKIFDITSCVMKADCNVSIKESGYVRSEIKNVTGFKEIERALFYEVERQRSEFKDGEKLIQDTRGWDSEKGVTRRLRKKETEEDYGYILDPDLVAISLDADWIKGIDASLPELHIEKAKRFVDAFGIPEEDAAILSSERSLADLFELSAKKVEPKLAVRWLRHELNKFLNDLNKSFSDTGCDPSSFIELLELVAEKRISDSTARDILEKLLSEKFSPKKYVEDNDLGMVSDSGELTKVCEKVVSENEAAAEDYRSGNQKSLNFLLGKVMQLTEGKASAAEVNNILVGLLKK
ncbi:MAG: Asp-tRNA(Asn)/Glu-tRNA(Gln) amidotransferase subunit GatB [Candidatus Bathyarchaeota archaeon]|nr:Asp-tRNA(Asn)/Glu-tRNA(Gln) amidotransferase subunit GatB [Candidatus Bathyarchaeota archaeon]